VNRNLCHFLFLFSIYNYIQIYDFVNTYICISLEFK